LLEAAKRENATPFDATRFTEVTLNHRGDRCSFEAILDDFRLSDPGLQRLGRIVRVQTSQAGIHRSGRTGFASDALGFARWTL